MLQQPAQKYPAFAPIGLPDRTWPDAVITQEPIWLSTDLRDGNQALIEPMDLARKLRMFELLVGLGFKEIEVGFPSASQVEFDFVRHLIEQRLIPQDVSIGVLTPARPGLIKRSFEAVEGAPRVIMHLYCATAPIMRRVVFGMNEDQIVELASSHAALIKELAAQQPQTHWTFEYSPEMFSGTELAFSKRVVDAVTDMWAPSPAHPCIINLPSTVEHCTPNIFADMIEWMHRHLARRESIVLSVHPHNDRGTGTAAGELALMAGAQRLEGCLFGNGERTGNLDLVNVALNLYTQGVPVSLDFSRIDDVRHTVEHCNQLPVHPRHPYAGDLVYTSFSGSHQDAIGKAFAARGPNDPWVMPYLPIDPQDLGRSYEAVIRVNSQSGKGGIAYLLEKEYGIEMPRRLQIEFSQVVQAVMDSQGRELNATDLWQIFEREYALAQPQAALRLSMTEQAPGGHVQLSAQVPWGTQCVHVQGQGNGPIDAFVNGWTAATGHELRVLDYREHAIGAGAQARAVAYVELRLGQGRTLFGVGIDPHIVHASIKALICGLQRAKAPSAA